MAALKQSRAPCVVVVVVVVVLLTFGSALPAKASSVYDGSFPRALALSENTQPTLLATVTCNWIPFGNALTCNDPYHLTRSTTFVSTTEMTAVAAPSSISCLSFAYYPVRKLEVATSLPAPLTFAA